MRRWLSPLFGIKVENRDHPLRFPGAFRGQNRGADLTGPHPQGDEKNVDSEYWMRVLRKVHSGRVRMTGDPNATGNSEEQTPVCRWFEAERFEAPASSPGHPVCVGRIMVAICANSLVWKMGRSFFAWEM